MGEVYLAVLQREGGFEKTLALKTILPSLASKADFAGLFETEAAMAAMLNHVNIVQVFDHGCIDGRSFLTMEYVEGPDLASLITALGDPEAAPSYPGRLSSLGLTRKAEPWSILNSMVICDSDEGETVCSIVSNGIRRKQRPTERSTK